MTVDGALRAVLAAMPGLYETEDVPAADKVVHLHLFGGAANWWLCEFDGEDRLFGFADLGDGGGEWGYVSLRELCSVRIMAELRLLGGDEVLQGAATLEWDRHWQARRFGEISQARGAAEC